MLQKVFAFALLIAPFPALAFETSQLSQGGSLVLADIAPLVAKSFSDRF